MRYVTITERHKPEPVWHGSYRAFEKMYLDILSVAEFCVLYQIGSLAIGPRAGNPPRLIRLQVVTVH